MNSYQLSVKYLGETPHQLLEGVFWRLFFRHHTPSERITDN
ncbi:hypothetical protein [Anabaena azotica]|nr:hypothetical protein [Anabaena azotica]